MSERWQQVDPQPGMCAGFGMVDPIEGYWWTACIHGLGHLGPHVDAEGFSRYPLRKRLADRQARKTMRVA